VSSSACTDVQAAVVRSVFAQRELAVEVDGWRVRFSRARLEIHYFIGFTVVLSVNSLRVFRRVPLAQVALAVKLRALIVEAVRHLMADDDADCAEVYRRVNVDVEERRLKNAAGKLMSLKLGL